MNIATRSASVLVHQHAVFTPRPIYQRRPVVVKADESNGASTSAPAEDRLEQIEASIKRKPSPKNKIPIRNVDEIKREPESNMSEWKEGQLFPEGWDRMNIFTRMTELYMGRRGMLFWANKIAYASVFVVIGSWILFRFVGPNLGLYKLAGDVQPPSF